MGPAGASPWRRSSRVQVRMPVVISGTLPDGKPFKETTHISTVSKFGARLKTLSPLQPGMEILVKPLQKKETSRFRVVWMGQEGTPRAGEAGIEYVQVSDLLGVAFPD
jgi:hypothetical protein